MVACKEIGEGKRRVPELLGDIIIDPIDNVEAYDIKLDSKRTNCTEVTDLLKRYVNRRRKSFVDIGVNI